MKVLFIARHFAYFRNYEAVIEALAARGHQVHLAAERGEELGGREMVERLAARHPGLSIGWVPERGDRWAAFATGLRFTLDYLRYLDAAYDTTPRLRERARERVPRLGHWCLAALGAGSRIGRRVTMGLLRACERALPRSTAIERFIIGQSPDAVLLTPLIGVVASPQLDCLQAAKELGYPTALCVWSWDHLSSKAIIRNVPDRIFVWNETQRSEAMALHGIPSERIAVTGAQCFDHWFDRQPSTDRAAFCRTVGLPADRPFILYVGSSLFRGTINEAEFAQRWIRTLRASGLQPLAGTPILVRPHPARMKEWAGVDLAAEPDVAVWGQSPVTADAKNGYFDSLFHSAVVVGLNTSAFLEAAIAGRPVCAPLLPEHYENQEGTIHFHYLTTVGGGLLHTARTLGEHAALLNNQLASGDRESERSRRFVEAFIRPHGRTVAATARLAGEVETLASAPRRAPAGAGVAAALLRSLLWPIAAGLGARWADGLMASERDRAIVARRRARHAVRDERTRAQAARKDEERRTKDARAAARQRLKAERAAEWRRTKRAKSWTRRGEDTPRNQ